MNELVGKRDRVSNYYSIKNGKVVKSLGKVQPDVMDGVTERVNKNGEKVYEIVSDYIRGRVVSLELQQPPEDKPDYKELMVITMQGGGVKAVVQIPFDSAYGRAFLLASDNVDWTQEVELEPWKYTDKKTGKEKMGLSIYQFGEQIPWAFGTKENPGDVPALEETTFKGKKVWDNTKQLKWFHDYYANLANYIKGASAAGAHEGMDEGTEEDEDGDF